MRVRCDKCEASYDLDLPPAALARGRRQKFRCTACGHRFVVVRADGTLTNAIVSEPAPPKVKRAPVSAKGPTAAVSPESVLGQPTIDLSSAARTEPPPPQTEAPTAAANATPGGPLFLRQDGVLYQVADLPTLQRWILERRVEPTGELSTGQEDWTPLTEVPELQSYFHVLDPAGGPTPRAPGPTGAAGDLARAAESAQAPASDEGGDDGLAGLLAALTASQGEGEGEGDDGGDAPAPADAHGAQAGEESSEDDGAADDDGLAGLLAALQTSSGPEETDPPAPEEPPPPASESGDAGDDLAGLLAALQTSSGPPDDGAANTEPPPAEPPATDEDTNSLSDLLSALQTSSAKDAPDPAFLTPDDPTVEAPAGPEETQESPDDDDDNDADDDLAEVLAMLLHGEDGEQEGEPSTAAPAPASTPAPDPGASEQLPADIEALLAGLGGGSGARPAGRPSSDGPAPELQQALNELPPDISALVSGLAESGAQGFQSARSSTGADALGEVAPTEQIGPQLPPAPSPFADEPYLELPTMGGEVPFVDEEEPKPDNTSRWLFLVAIALFAVGLWAIFGRPSPVEVEPEPTPAVTKPVVDLGEPDTPPTPDTPDGDDAASAEADPEDAGEGPDDKPEAATASKPSTTPRPRPSTPPQTRSNDVRALLRRGWTEVDRSKWSDAEELFSRAAQVSPENGQAHYGLGYVAEKQGSPNDAYREYCVAWAFSTGDVELRREITGRLNVLNRSCD